jgi:flavin reductase (DIM6/NTAB) family NADH-FMN oxidoreductase RutF
MGPKRSGAAAAGFGATCPLIFASGMVKMVLTSEEGWKDPRKKAREEQYSNRLPLKAFMLDQRSFRQIMGCFATGVAVVTTGGATRTAAGLTVNSLTSVSLEPPLVLFCLDRAAHVYPLFKASGHFAFNFLAEGQEAVSRHFADRHHNAQPKNILDKPQQKCPILRHTLGWILCRKAKVIKAGDHDIFIGEVIKAHKRGGSHNPLLYFHGRYRSIKA